MSVRIGIGYDVHRLAAGRRLVLGGVRIEHPRGLAGHSDADVLCHAAADALLGSAALGDLGEHFPDTDPRWQDASSLKLLARTAALVAGAGWRICNIDATVIAQAPRLAPFRAQMRANLADACSIALHQVSIKATTTEKLGLCGREEGIAAQAIACVEQQRG